MEFSCPTFDLRNSADLFAILHMAAVSPESKNNLMRKIVA
jgi:hypothetical protein